MCRRQLNIEWMLCTNRPSKDGLIIVWVQIVSFVALGLRSCPEPFVFELAFKMAPMARHALTLRFANLDLKCLKRILELAACTGRTQV